MSTKRLFAKWAQDKDREAVRVETNNDPKLLCRALVCLFGPWPERGAKVIPENRLKRFCNISDHMDLAIMRQLVGQGFIRPTPKSKGLEHYSSQIYLITRKGWNEILNNSADVTAEDLTNEILPLGSASA